MPSRPNSVAEAHPTNVPHQDDGMHPYRTLDRFAPSISLQLRNRRKGTVHSVEEIDLPPSLSNRVFKNREDEDGRSLDGRTQMRSSFESGRSRVSATAQTHTQTRSQGQPTRPLGDAVQLETRTGNRRSSSYHNQPSIPDFIQETRLPYREPSGNLENYASARRPPETPAAANPRVRSNSTFSFMTRRHRQRPSISESFLPAPYDEEKADSNASGSPHSKKSLRTPRLGARAILEENITLCDQILIFLTDIVPHQIYLHCLLRLPYFYFSRVEQIFDSANLTLEQMKHMALQVSAQGGGGGGDDDERVMTEIPRAYRRLKKAWERFIDNLLREWKTLNIISGLLLSGILTIFQIDGTQKEPVTRYMAFWSLISALLSLLYGCIFIIRFSGMRRVYQATEWAIEAQRSGAMFWNVWVMLAMPAVWLVWSILAYIVCIMAFMWRVNPDNPKPTLGPQAERCFKAFICCVLGVGILYAILIVNTLRQYGSKMDKSWRDRIAEFRSEHVENAPRTPLLSPLLDMRIVEPTPPQTWNRLYSLPWRTDRTTPPQAANQPSLPGPTNRSAPYIPDRPSPTTSSGLRGSLNLPSPSNFGEFLTLDPDRTFSASPTAMTPDALTPAHSPLVRPLDEIPGTPETGVGTLGLIFEEEGEDLEEGVTSTGIDEEPESNMTQRVDGDEAREPDSDTALVVQVVQPENSDHIDSDEGMEVGRDEPGSQPAEASNPVPSSTPH